MAVLCGMPTIEYLARSTRLSVHKLFTSCIWWCLVSCDSVVDGDRLSATEWCQHCLLCYLITVSNYACFSSTSVSQAAQQHTWFSQYHTSPKIWRGFLYGAYRSGEWLQIDFNSKMETRHLVLVVLVVNSGRSVIIAEIWQPEVARR